MPRPTSLFKGFAREIATAKPNPNPKRRKALFDPEERGLCVRITPKGRKSYFIVARVKDGKQVWVKVGDVDKADIEGSLNAARALAPEVVRRIKAGLEPFPKIELLAAPDSFAAVADNFLKRQVDKRKLRSAAEIERHFKVYVLPAWKDRPFIEIRRSDVAKLLDRIEDNNGPVMADRVLATLRALFNWYAAREDNFNSPIVRGMARTRPKERERTRTLCYGVDERTGKPTGQDWELRLIWPLLTGTYGAMVKMGLLTGQRREKIVTMRWDHIAKDGTWTIPSEAREKSNAHSLRLPEAALAVINAQRKIDNNPYVFAGAGGEHVKGYSALKRAMDKRIMEALKQQAIKAEDDPAKVKPLEPWVFHDTRRTSRTLLQRAGLTETVAERILGHVQGGVATTYNRHPFEDEKADALEKLAAQIERILKPPADNVTELRKAAK